MLVAFRVYNLDNGTLIVVCGNCGYHLVITKDTMERARANTVLAQVTGDEKNVE